VRTRDSPPPIRGQTEMLTSVGGRLERRQSVTFGTGLFERLVTLHFWKLSHLRIRLEREGMVG